MPRPTPSTRFSPMRTFRGTPAEKGARSWSSASSPRESWTGWKPCTRRCALASQTTIDRARGAAVPADELAAFWDDRAKAFVRSDPEGWSAVCHRGAPLYFNRFIDWSQRRAVERLFRLVELQPGDPAADIGCGTGRWAKELGARGLAARGFDVSPVM